MMNVFFAYARGSTVTPQHSLAAQSQKLQLVWEMLYQQTLLWGEVYADATTTAHIPFAQRPRGKLLLERLQPGDHVAIAKTSCAFASLPEALTQLDAWYEQGIIVHLLDMPGLTWRPGMGKTMLQLVPALEAMKRNLTCERIHMAMNHPQTKAKMASRTARGKLTNHPGYGYRHRGAAGRKVRVVDAKEQEAIARITAWREQENLSWDKIAIRLLRQRIRTKDGRDWSSQRCRRAYLQQIQRRSQTTTLPAAPSLALSDFQAAKPLPCGPAT
jgi:DNA invertase Pin-like site-specific DNA recombinase